MSTVSITEFVDASFIMRDAGTPPRTAAPGAMIATTAAPATRDPAFAEQAFIVRAGGVSWALPARAVQTVFRIASITPVPLAPLVIEGLVNLRGRVVSPSTSRAECSAACFPSCKSRGQRLRSPSNAARTCSRSSSKRR